MRLSTQQITSLKALLKEHTGKDYTDEQAQEAGMAIMRFVIAKSQREKESTNMEKNHEQTS